MTVTEWIKDNKDKKFAEFTIITPYNEIILDDRIAYLKDRSPEYNESWKSRCRGKKVLSVKHTNNGYVLTVGNELRV